MEGKKLASSGFSLLDWVSKDCTKLVLLEFSGASALVKFRVSRILLFDTQLAAPPVGLSSDVGGYQCHFSSIVERESMFRYVVVIMLPFIANLPAPKDLICRYLDFAFAVASSDLEVKPYSSGVFRRSLP